jgi:hypothetical protein
MEEGRVQTHLWFCLWKTPVKRSNIECSQHDDDKEHTNDSNKEGEGESDDDKDTVVWDATEMIEFIDNAKEKEGGESG